MHANVVCDPERSRSRRAVLAAAAITATASIGCGAAASGGPAPTVPARAASAAPAGNLDDLYSEAIFQAAVLTPGDTLPLVPLKPDPDGTFTATTWADCEGTGGPNQCGHYIAGSSIGLTSDVWVTSNGEVQKQCQTWTGDIALKIQQLLGMPPPEPPLPPDTRTRQFVTLSHIPAASIFRPCTDPRVDTDHCAGATLPPTLPPNAPHDYWRWFTNQAMSSWQIPPKGQPPTGFPWTRLGYTYNWISGAPSRYGASEYVVSGSSKAVTVTVASVQAAKDFCKQQ